MTGRSVPEWHGATPDAAIPHRVRVRLFDAGDRRCAICKRSLFGGDRWQADHIIALVNGGEHRERNLQVVCEWCHREKTAADVAEKSRVYRQRAAHLGIRKSKNPIKGWRRFNGEPVRNPRI